MKKLSKLESFFSIKNSTEGCKQVTIFGISFNYNLALKNNKVCKETDVQNKKIVFMNYFGKPYGCNPKYIAEEIIKRNLPLDLIWLCEKIDAKTKKQFPSQIKLVKYKSKQCIKEMASAKFWISNHHFVPLIKIGLRKKEKQYYIQTWHGSLGIKRIEKNVEHLANDIAFMKNSQLNADYTNYWISNSSFETQVYKDAFEPIKDSDIMQIGHPRNDIFFMPDETKKVITAKVHSKLNISPDKKILLYAPSFRDEKRLDCFNINSEKILNTVKTKFGNEWVLAIRMHPRLAKESKKIFKFSKEIINASAYPDIQELLMASEAMITDYSRCIFDFMLSRKPAFIFATDIEKYNTERGFYYPLETTPFPIAKNNEELIENIKNFDYEKYKNEVELFLQEKGCIEDGHASEKIVDLIEKLQIINKEEKQHEHKQTNANIAT